ncbi:MAG TPA: TetR/AcrR family transcriptional regulator [Propionibacteriaceae bacterium]|nr:TetR/AcrR family transcriptional regulator [Propionibacteriaceae bacterium]
MQRRSTRVAQTRQRILDAATELFSTRGAQATTMNEVARRADVSPTTVINHFPTQDQLLEAVVAGVLADIRVPDLMIFSGTRSLTARLRVLTTAMFAFFERTSHWFELLGTELAEVPALARAEAEFWSSIRLLYEQALAGSDDNLLAKTTAGLLHPATFGALKAAGMSVDEAATVVAGLLVHQARGGNR